MAADSAYSPSQIAAYLEYIGLPQSFHPSANPVLDLAYLTTLFTHQITAIPYDNLSIHYSPQHAITLDPQALFAKMVTSPRRGRGGYCMENSILFNHVLRALGFRDAYLVGARVRPRVDGVPHGAYMGWVHLVNIVTLPPGGVPGGGAGQRYALDAGFGGDGMTVPMPLVEGLAHRNSIGSQEIRLTRGFIPEQRYRANPAVGRMWIYQVRNGPDREWRDFFAFHDEFEFTEADFGNISFYTSQSPDSFQTTTPLAIRFVRGQGEGEGEGGDGAPPSKVRVVGKVMLVKGEVKRNFGGRTELVKRCVTERERVEALREYFGIVLTEEEAQSIRGRSVELRGEAGEGEGDR